MAMASGNRSSETQDMLRMTFPFPVTGSKSARKERLLILLMIKPTRSETKP